uniref:PRA1 family protein n=1 Tax=Oryza glaberrima TaxID=4538 RepID=I1QX22_ORYGL
MAAASPPLLPTTVLPANTTATVSPAPTSVSSADANPAATRAFLARLLDSVKRALSGARPWPELIDRSALSRPESLSDAGARLRKNLAYFRVNYAAIVALSLAATLLAHPFSLAALLALLAAWCFLYLLRPSDAPPLAAFGRTFSDRETLGGLIGASAFVVFLTSVGSLIFSALALGAAIVCAHGAFRIPEDLFLDEPDQANGAASVNLLSFITSATGGRELVLTMGERERSRELMRPWFGYMFSPSLLANALHKGIA